MVIGLRASVSLSFIAVRFAATSLSFPDSASLD
jgi:hypothetical protein